MDDTTRTPLTGDPEIDALVAEMEDSLERWGLLIEEQLETAHQLADLAALEEEFTA
jgi:hypothetical protein